MAVKKRKSSPRKRPELIWRSPDRKWSLCTGGPHPYTLYQETYQSSPYTGTWRIISPVTHVYRVAWTADECIGTDAPNLPEYVVDALFDNLPMETKE
jgi:hypothetical protein